MDVATFALTKMGTLFLRLPGMTPFTLWPWTPEVVLNMDEWMSFSSNVCCVWDYCRWITRNENQWVGLHGGSYSIALWKDLCQTFGVAFLNIFLSLDVAGQIKSNTLSLFIHSVEAWGDLVSIPEVEVNHIVSAKVTNKSQNETFKCQETPKLL